MNDIILQFYVKSMMLEYEHLNLIPVYEVFHVFEPVKFMHACANTKGKSAKKNYVCTPTNPA